MQSVGKVAEEAGGSTWKPPGDPKAHVHGRLDAGTSSTEFFFFYSPANLTPRFETVLFFRWSRLPASGKEGCGRVTSNQNISFSLGGSEETFEPYTDMMRCQKGLLSLSAWL